MAPIRRPISPNGMPKGYDQISPYRQAAVRTALGADEDPLVNDYALGPGNAEGKRAPVPQHRLPLPQPTTPTTPEGSGTGTIPTPDPANKVPSGWDTHGYSTPAYTTGTPGSTLLGWDPNNWANANMQTPKYVVGRILSQYNPTSPDDVSKMVAEVQRAYPGTTWDGKDKLTIPGVGTIDIIAGAGGANPSWAWQDTAAAGYNTPAPNPLNPLLGMNSGSNPYGGMSPFSPSSGGGGTPSYSTAILQYLLQTLLGGNV